MIHRPRRIRFTSELICAKEAQKRAAKVFIWWFYIFSLKCIMICRITSERPQMRLLLTSHVISFLMTLLAGEHLHPKPIVNLISPILSLTPCGCPVLASFIVVLIIVHHRFFFITLFLFAFIFCTYSGSVASALCIHSAYSIFILRISKPYRLFCLGLLFRLRFNSVFFFSQLVHTTIYFSA